MGRFKSWKQSEVGWFQMVPCYIAATKMWVPGVFAIVHVYFGFYLFVEFFFGGR